MANNSCNSNTPSADEFCCNGSPQVETQKDDVSQSQTVSSQREQSPPFIPKKWPKVVIQPKEKALGVKASHKLFKKKMREQLAPSVARKVASKFALAMVEEEFNHLNF